MRPLIGLVYARKSFLRPKMLPFCLSTPVCYIRPMWAHIPAAQHSQRVQRDPAATAATTAVHARLAPSELQNCTKRTLSWARDSIPSTSVPCLWHWHNPGSAAKRRARDKHKHNSIPVVQLGLTPRLRAYRMHAFLSL